MRTLYYPSLLSNVLFFVLLSCKLPLSLIPLVFFFMVFVTENFFVYRSRIFHESCSPFFQSLHYGIFHFISVPRLVFTMEYSISSQLRFSLHCRMFNLLFMFLRFFLSNIPLSSYYAGFDILQHKRYVWFQIYQRKYFGRI